MRRILSIMFLTFLLVSMFNIQQAKAETGTIYIRADGSIDPPTAPIQRVSNTYTFTGDIYGSIVVERDNIVIDGAGHALQGTGGGIGITLAERTNVTIRNTQIKNFEGGIGLESSNNNVISWNNIANNKYGGIWLKHSSNNVISGNNIENNGGGIGLESSNNNVISWNNIANNKYGVSLSSSSSNVIRGNTFINDGLFVEYSYGNVVEDNTVNGKPLVYLEGVKNYNVSDAGQVILVNCDGIRVENLNLSRASVGIELWGTRNSIISGNNIIANNWCGICLYSSSNNNTVSGNNIANNWYGIYLSSSSSNTISGNNIENNWYGIELGESSSNVISGNRMENNGKGIVPAYSSSNVIRGNTFINDGLFVWFSYGNVVEDNTVNGKPLVYLEGVKNYNVSDAGQVILVNCDGIRVENLNLSRTIVGVELYKTINSIINRNNIENNKHGGILLKFSSNNVISGNNIRENNEHGISLYSSSNNVIRGNNIENNYGGIWIVDSPSSNNRFYHNNFINNCKQVEDTMTINVWDDGYPSGGNYWSDYSGKDADGDGIGDTPYFIIEDIIDRYPLMKPGYLVCIDGECDLLKVGSLIPAQPDLTALGGLIIKRFEGYLDPSGNNLGKSIVVNGPLSLSAAYREEVNLSLLAIILAIILVSSFLLIRKLKIRERAKTEVEEPTDVEKGLATLNERLEEK